MLFYDGRLRDCRFIIFEIDKVAGCFLIPLLMEGKNELRRLGDSVRHHRKLLKVSQEDFATVTGHHRTYIGQVERGEKNISFSNLLRIANALNLKTSQLLAQSKL